MAFLKFSRDKRGYEHFSLVQPANNRRGKARPRLLYWFRTPPNLKVGREPFDPETRQALETHNRGVAFDWTAIVEAPIPPADTERWRERRRADRAFRKAAETRTDEAPETQIEEAADLDQVEPAPPAPIPVIVVPSAADALGATFDTGPIESSHAGEALSTSYATLPVPDAPGPARHRRRRAGAAQGSGSRFRVSGSGFWIYQ